MSIGNEFQADGAETAKALSVNRRRVRGVMKSPLDISQKLLKIEAYKQRMEKKLYLSPIQMSHVFGPSVTAFYRVSQKVSDVIPVLRITPRATELSTVSVFLSVVKCGSVCRAQTCAHSGIKPFRLAKGFPQGGPKSSKKIEFLTISKI